MFDRVRTAEEAKSAKKLCGLYHKGQHKIWDGEQELAAAIARHGAPNLDDDKREALRNLFAVILWGELAAWKISARLTHDLKPLEAKMAATAQTHDESRHFYVMHDYLQLLGEIPGAPSPWASRMIGRVASADSLPKMLLGMQLMIEPLALTLFQIIRERNVEPVLCDLLVLFDRDEARHVALGTLHLPALLEDMGRVESARLLTWQLTQYLLQFEMLKEHRLDLETLGIDVRNVYGIARRRQVKALQLLAEGMDRGLPMTEVLLRLSDFKAELDFPRENSGLSTRVVHGLGAAMKDLTRRRFDGAPVSP